MPMIYVPTFESLLIFGLAFWLALIIFQFKTKNKLLLVLYYFPWVFIYGVLIVLAKISLYLSIVLLHLSLAIDQGIPEGR